MNCKEFKENVLRITRDAISKGLRLSGDLEEIQEKEYDPDLSEIGKAKWRERAKEKQAEINSCFEKMMGEIRAQADDLIAFAEETQVLQGAKLTDDARLFTDGIPLTADDLRQIIARSDGNHTMLQLAENYRLKYFANDRSLPVYRSIKTQIISLANRTVDDCQFLAHFPQKQYVQEQFMNAINQTLDQLPENDGH